MKENTKVYTVIGIGIGPFNLGLAALLHPVEEIASLFFDTAEGFNWHPGLMLDSATLQTPFMGTDLVTMADPTSRFSFLNYLKQTDRLYKFFIRENFFILRSEYNAYGQWVAAQLSNCRFGHTVTAIRHHEGLYELTVTHQKTGVAQRYYAEKLVLGTGTQPYVPPFVKRQALSKAIHTSQYLYHKEDLLKASSVCIIGSGQSAAEIYYDLMPALAQGLQLHWLTRSDRYFPMEYAKLTLELTSPEYVDYFYHLPAAKRREVVASQHGLYKGINFDLINQIFDRLYEMTVGNTTLPTTLRANCQLNAITPAATNLYQLDFTEVQQQQDFSMESEYVILATGYTYHEPPCIAGIQHRIKRTPDHQLDVDRYYTVDIHHQEIFVQNAELHTHGFVTPDLGMGAYRNSCIINTMAGKEIYPVEKRIAYQAFGTPTSEIIPESIRDTTLVC